MGEESGVVKARNFVDQNTAIKKAVEALGVSSDPSKLLLLLSSCSSEAKRQELLKKAQNQLRRKFDKEVWIEYSQEAKKEIAYIKNWTAQAVDKEALSGAAIHIVKKLWADPKAKIPLDSWLQEYNLHSQSGKLQWLKDFCKNTLNQEIVLSVENKKIVASLKGELKLPSVPKAPIPLALKRDNQKTREELQAEASKPITKKVVGAILDEAASIVAVSDEIGQDLAKGEVLSATKRASTYVGKKVDALATTVILNVPKPIKEGYQDYIKPTVDTVVATATSAWKKVTELAESIDQKAKFISVDKASQPSPIGGLEKKSQSVISRADVIKKDSTEPGVISLSSRALNLPKVVSLSDVEPKQVEHPKITALGEIPKAATQVISTNALAISLPPREFTNNKNDEVQQKNLTPKIESVSIESLPVLQPNLRIIDLQVESKPKFLDLMMSTVKTTINEWELKKEEISRSQIAPNAIQAVVEAMSNAEPAHSVRRGEERSKEEVRQVTNRVEAVIAGLTPTSSSIRDAELALLALVNSNASTIEIEQVRALIRVAKDRLEENEARNDGSAKRALDSLA